MEKIKFLQKDIKRLNKNIGKLEAKKAEVVAILKENPQNGTMEDKLKEINKRIDFYNTLLKNTKKALAELTKEEPKKEEIAKEETIEEIEEKLLATVQALIFDTGLLVESCVSEDAYNALSFLANTNIIELDDNTQALVDKALKHKELIKERSELKQELKELSLELELAKTDDDTIYIEELEKEIEEVREKLSSSSLDSDLDLTQLKAELAKKNLEIAEPTLQCAEYLISENEENATKKLNTILKALLVVLNKAKAFDTKKYVDIGKDNWGNTVAYLTNSNDGAGVAPEIEPDYII